MKDTNIYSSADLGLVLVAAIFLAVFSCEAVDAWRRWRERCRRAPQAPGTGFETWGALTGIAGAFLLAMPALPGYGFGAFLVSNVCWLVFSSRNRHWRMFVQQLVFLVSSLLGLWNWWLGPLLIGGAA